MDFVDAHGRLERLPLPSLRQPGVVGPGELGGAPDDGGILRRDFKERAVRIGLQDDFAVGVEQLELVERAFAQARHEKLPHAADAEQAHRVVTAVPLVERADDADALGVRRPDGEAHAGDAVNDPQLRAELVVNAALVAFVEEK